MAVREFTDASGTRWKAWNITPESIHPVTRAEDYLVDCFQLGWLVFENVAGTDKRRLCPYPERWNDCSDQQLVGMLTKAERVPPIKLMTERQIVPMVYHDRPAPASSSDDTAVTTPPDVTDLRVVRTFRYPGGRFWTVCVMQHPEDGGPPRLHFSAGMRTIELRSWPRDWPDYPDEQLAELLRWAAPRPNQATLDAETPKRRWNDGMTTNG